MKATVNNDRYIMLNISGEKMEVWMDCEHWKEISPVIGNVREIANAKSKRVGKQTMTI